jgi:hypothetical protein
MKQKAEAADVDARTLRRWKRQYKETLGRENSDPIHIALLKMGMERLDREGWPEGCSSPTWADRVQELVRWKVDPEGLRVFLVPCYMQ